MHPLLEVPGKEIFLHLVTTWLTTLRKGRGTRLEDGNVNVLKGLADPAIEGYRKISGLGPRSAKVDGAYIYALRSVSGLHSVAQLERIRLNVKQSVNLKRIEEAAQRTGTSRDDLVELRVPMFDLEQGAFAFRWDRPWQRYRSRGSLCVSSGTTPRNDRR